jgi:hypothetical protein
LLDSTLPSMVTTESPLFGGQFGKNPYN